MRVLIIAVVVLLTGCASNAKFDCPASGGVNCTSISRIDQMVDEGSLEQHIGKRKRNKRNKEYIAIKPSFEQKTLANAPTRTTEQVLQLWVAPYEGLDGIYYQQAFVNVVVRNGGWVKPVVDDLTMVQ